MAVEKKIDQIVGLKDTFFKVVEDHTAGSPQQGIVWTNIKPREIAEKITAAGKEVSRNIARQLMKDNGFVLRQSQKKKSYRQHPNRQQQFEYIRKLKMKYLAENKPVISIDTKKKELIGTFYRAGKLYTKETIEVWDHDFPSYARGKVVPHGIYDIALNKAHINIGTSSDTTEFACDSLLHWWRTFGVTDYPHAKHLLILCDGGGSNPANSYLFKQDIQRLANETGLEIRLAHYPAYCSKHHPIEHRVFPHVTRACQGVVFDCVETVRQLIAQTSTCTGLQVSVDVLDRVYETGRKVAKDIASKLNLVLDDTLPRWNYTLSPHTTI